MMTSISAVSHEVCPQLFLVKGHVPESESEVQQRCCGNNKSRLIQSGIRPYAGYAEPMLLSDSAVSHTAMERAKER
jgi:hypothetical protein